MIENAKIQTVEKVDEFLKTADERMKKASIKTAALISQKGRPGTCADPFFTILLFSEDFAFHALGHLGVMFELHGEHPAALGR